MQPEKDQNFIFSSEDLSLIKNTFADNDELLFAIRNVLLQFPVSDGQKALLSMQVTPAVIAVLKKRMLPSLAPTYPIGQLPSLLTTLTENLKVLSIQEMEPLFRAKTIEIEYLDQQFQVLETGDFSNQHLILEELGRLVGKTAYDQYVDMQAYLFLLGYIDPCLAMIKVIAGEKNESSEDQKKRLTRNSNK